jgi:hypothetical protein
LEGIGNLLMFKFFCHFGLHYHFALLKNTFMSQRILKASTEGKRDSQAHHMVRSQVQELLQRRRQGKSPNTGFTLKKMETVPGKGSDSCC